MQKIRRKLDALREFARIIFPDEEHRYEWWSPYVPVGALTSAIEDIVAEWHAADRDLRFIVNERYTEAMRELAAHARKNSSTTSEPAYRMLQILTRLRGGHFDV